MTGFYKKDGELWCDGVPVMDIARGVGTPLYLYSYDLLKQNYNAYVEGFKEISPLICYAYKANSNIAILKALTHLGAGADVLSIGELFKAIKVGVPRERIVFNGNGKREDEIRFALMNEILMINIDLCEELLLVNRISGEIGKRARVALRINPNIDPKTHPSLSTALKESKFGIGINKAMDSYKFAASLSNIDVVGIHLHIGSQITEISPFIEALRVLVDLVMRLKEDGIEIKYINIGGGLGVRYLDETPPSPKELADAIIPLLSNIDAKLILEPGRSVVAKAGILVAKVLYIKEGDGKRFIVLDAGMNDFIRPILYGGYHKIVPIKDDAKEEIVGDIVGPICEEGDFFARDRKIPMVEVGDYLAIMDTGAYGFVMASNYNSRPLPPEVMVIGTRYYEIRRRQGLEEMMANELIPEELTL